ncbi:hypothetical protein J4462_04960 [Candidatus Pacearchaeota archaeon]|nr:hypothetical protein [Candidatus Pacearchaeota archaeon]
MTTLEKNMARQGYSLLISRDWSSENQRDKFMMMLAQIRSEAIKMQCFRDGERRIDSKADIIDIYVPREYLNASRQILRDNNYEHPNQRRFNFF